MQWKWRCCHCCAVERLHASFCHGNGSHFGAQPHCDTKMAAVGVAKLLLCCDIMCFIKHPLIHTMLLSSVAVDGFKDEVFK